MLFLLVNMTNGLMGYIIRRIEKKKIFHPYSIQYTTSSILILFVLILGTAGLVYATLKKNLLIFLWVVPFLIFFYIIRLVDPSHLIVLLPAFCIASAVLILDLSNKFTKKKIAPLLPYVIVLGVGIFGLVNVMSMITQNVTSPYFKARCIRCELLTKK